MRPAMLAIALCAMIAGEARSQALPFRPGERLTYAARIGGVGRGTAVMWVEGPVAVRGQQAYHLRFDIKAKVGFINVLNASESWLDAPRMASLRFHKHERHPLSRTDQRAEIFPDEQRWASSDGGSGRTISEHPLDELSFIYFLRTVDLPATGALRFDRHFEMARNPTLVRVIGRETLETRAGTFRTIVVDMEVKDGRYGSGGTIRLHLSDDVRRLPVRIESSIPMAGRAVLLLTAYTPAPTGVVAQQ
jgi:hypothetical protein